MTHRIDLANEKKPVRDFIRRLGEIPEPVELELDGKLVAKLIPPTRSIDSNHAKLVARARQLLRQSQQRNTGVPAKSVERVVRDAVESVRRQKHR